MKKMTENAQRKANGGRWQCLKCQKKFWLLAQVWCHIVDKHKGMSPYQWVW